MFVVRANYRATPETFHGNAPGRRPKNWRASLPRRIRRTEEFQIFAQECHRRLPTLHVRAADAVQCVVCPICFQATIRAFALRVLFLYIYCLLIRVLYKLHLVPVDLTGKQAK
jgi:hypothetical protein